MILYCTSTFDFFSKHLFLFSSRLIHFFNTSIHYYNRYIKTYSNDILFLFKLKHYLTENIFIYLETSLNKKDSGVDSAGER